MTPPPRHATVPIYHDLPDEGLFVFICAQCGKPLDGAYAECHGRRGVRSTELARRARED